MTKSLVIDVYHRKVVVVEAPEGTSRETLWQMARIWAPDIDSISSEYLKIVEDVEVVMALSARE